MYKKMNGWMLDHLGGSLKLKELPMPKLRAGSVLVKVEAQALMSYLKPYVEGKLAAYRAPKDFVPGGNAIGRIEALGEDIWQLKVGQRVVVSSHLLAQENTTDPGQILIGVTSPGAVGDAMQQSWKDGTLAEYVLVPASVVTPIDGLDYYSAIQLAAITRCAVP